MDQSLNGTGVCVLAEDGHVLALLTLTQARAQGDARLLHLRQALATHLEGVTFAAMEGYAYHAVNRAFVLGEVGGVKGLLLERAIPYLIVPPIQVKQFATGSVRAEKEDMLRAACALGARPGSDDNQADAFFLARIARAFTCGDARLRCELEVIHSLRHPKIKKPDRRPRRLVKNAI